MLNSFLKHGIIVGISTCLLSLMLTISEIFYVRYILATPDDFSSFFIAKHLGTFAFAFTSVIMSLIMIWGIAKKRHKLLVPWLLLCFVIFVLVTFSLFYENLTLGYTGLDDFIVCLFIVAFGINLIYPIYILYIEIHLENLTGPSNRLKNHRDI